MPSTGIRTNRWEESEGSPFPLGATWMEVDGSFNFSIYSKHAAEVRLLLYSKHHLPLVADHRRRRGFPHRILLDECHYFLDGTHGVRLLDSQLDCYTLVTYRPSQLPASVLKRPYCPLRKKPQGGSTVSSSHLV